MADKRLIRITLQIDVTLDHQRYSGGDDTCTADDAVELIKELTENEYGLGQFLRDWHLLEGGDLDVRIVGR